MKELDNEKVKEMKEFLLIFDIKAIELYDNEHIILHFIEIEKMREEFRYFVNNLKHEKERRIVFEEIVCYHNKKQKEEFEKLQKENKNLRDYIDVLKHSLEDCNERKYCEIDEKSKIEFKFNELKKKSDYLTNHNRQLIEYIEDYRKMNQLLEEKMKRSEENDKQNKK